MWKPEWARLLRLGLMALCAGSGSLPALAAEPIPPPSSTASPPSSEWWDASRQVSVLDSSPLRGEIESVPAPAILEAEGAVIGEIYIQRNNVFDPSLAGEDRLLFRSANRLHMRTRERVVEQKLLFRTGDLYSRRILQETERYLRSMDFLYDAWIGPVRYRHNTVDILVVTRDVWTLGASAGFQHSGGEETVGFEVRDSNFLGSGRFVTLKYQDDPERSAYLFRYYDSAVLGSRAEMRVLYSDNSDGHRRTLDLGRPFYSLDTRWSVGARLVSDDRTSRLYSDSRVYRVFRQEVQSLDLFMGYSPGYKNRATQRFFFGLGYEDHVFSRHAEDPGRRGAFPTGLDRTITYPWIGYERVKDRYIETHNLDQLSRTEDLNLGTELRLRLGWSSEAFGASRDEAIVSAELETGHAWPRGDLLLFRIGADGRVGMDDHQNLVAAARVEYYLPNFRRFQLYLQAEGAAVFHPDPENQLLLGGDTGLRGYPRNFQTGDRRFLLTLEQRFYSDLQLFELLYVGAAAFVDWGRAWHVESDPTKQFDGELRDIGLGLRLSSSRSSEGKMIHFDVAYPLDGEERDVQWLVTTRDTF